MTTEQMEQEKPRRPRPPKWLRKLAYVCAAVVLVSFAIGTVRSVWNGSFNAGDILMEAIRVFPTIFSLGLI